MRVFLAHPKAWQNDKIDSGVAYLAERLTTEMGEAVTVVSGRDDFMTYAASEGSFSSWSRSISRRIDSSTRQRVYRAIVVPGTRNLGRATAEIVQAALSEHVPVLSWDEDTNEITAVRDVVAEDPDNWKSGWKVIV
jgi:hypothetical protein